MSKIRTRFAVSPTGFMHIGGVRTALFSYFIANQAGGEFILRIEDTDKAREVEGSVPHIIESLHWLGLNWAEGPDIGGPHASYTQSERLELYADYTRRLIAAGRAYVDTTPQETVEQWRTASQIAKKPFLFREHREDALKRSVEWDGSQTVRFISNPHRVEWEDAVRGTLSAGEEALDDFVIMKSDGFPTYNFCHVIDDFEMKITHVVRGEEFIASTPKFIDLMEALDFPRPTFVTVPPILNQNGGKKLSKRDGARDVLYYRDQGYMPEAVINFLASMGWNDGTEQEVFTKDEIMKSFSIDRIQSSGARYDEERLLWLSGHHIRRTSVDDLYAQIASEHWPVSSKDATDEYKKQVLSLVHERLKFFAELPELTEFFFERIAPQKEMLLKKLDAQTAESYITEAIEQLSNVTFTHEELETSLRALVTDLDAKTGVLFRLLRVSVVGGEIAPGLFETMATLGKDETLERLAIAKSLLN